MYEFREVTIDEKCFWECSTLLNKVFTNTNKFTTQYLAWEYKDNPIGNIVGFNAYYEGKLAAHYVTQPIKALINGVEKRGLLSLNTATHPNHQGKKLFTTLAEKTYELGAEMGFDFVYGVANANSTPGFIKKLGFQLIAPLEVKVGLGSIKKDFQAYPFSFERLWSKEELQWRLNNPSQRYSLNNEKILVPSGKPVVNAILGTFSKEELANIRLFNELKKFGLMNLYVGLDPTINWRKSLYFDVPNKFKSSPLNLIYRDLKGQEQLDKNSVKFQVIDFDGY